MSYDPAIRNLIAVSLGAIAGALSRYYISLWFLQRFGIAYPYGTFVINITGCFVMGFFFTLSAERIMTISPEIRLLVATGFLGSYTTFSTYGLETITLLCAQGFVTALTYWLGSALVGILSVQMGVIVARLLK